MPIVAGDIDYFLSGGSANTDPNAALGGAISTTEIADATLHNLFDIISSDESLAGDTEYRCFYVKNSHATLTALSTKIWIQTNTPSPGTSVEIGLGSSAVNGTEQTVGNESTAPGSVSFSAAANEGAALSIGDLAPGETKAVWVKRIVGAAAAAYNSDSAVIRTKCDTAA